MESAATAVEASSASAVEASSASAVEFASATAVKFTAPAVSTSDKAVAFIASALKAAACVGSSFVASAPVAATFAAPTFMAPAPSPAAPPEFRRMSPVVPRTGSHKEAANKVVRPVEPIWRAGVGVIVVVSVRADWRPTHVYRPTDTHPDSDLRL